MRQALKTFLKLAGVAIVYALGGFLPTYFALGFLFLLLMILGLNWWIVAKSLPASWQDSSKNAVTVALSLLASGFDLWAFGVVFVNTHGS